MEESLLSIFYKRFIVLRFVLQSYRPVQPTTLLSTEDSGIGGIVNTPGPVFFFTSRYTTYRFINSKLLPLFCNLFLHEIRGSKR